MNLIKQSHEIWSDIDGDKILKHIERCGRVCYQSFDRYTEDGSSAKSMVNMLTNVKKHHSVLEHYSLTVNLITDRAVTHELVRHRIASYSQESQRYVGYATEKHGKSITFIDQGYFEPYSVEHDIWQNSLEVAEKAYLDLVSRGIPKEFARSVLPNCTKTDIVVTANLREWIHIFNLRTSKAAHPDIRNLLNGVLTEFKEKIPVIFDSI